MSKKLEELTKLNFWDAIKVMRPLAWAHFEKWIDEYKVDNDWKELFNPTFRETEIKRIYERPKFHDLPAAMQLGIFMQYNADNCDKTGEWLTVMKEMTIDFMKLLDEELASKQ